MKSWAFDSPLDDPCREAAGWVSAARAEWDADDFDTYSPSRAYASEPAPVLPPGPYSVDRERASYPARSRSADPLNDAASGDWPDAA